MGIRMKYAERKHNRAIRGICEYFKSLSHGGTGKQRGEHAVAELNSVCELMNVN